MAETRSFQAQTRKLLDLMIHSIYSHKEIFLRELISNASDAIDKARFEALTRPELNTGEHKIKLATDAEAHTLTISDTGIGMSYDEVVENIGTIARSGSEQFAEKLRAAGSEAATPDLIGQFGVGFYSAFMVAKKVVLETYKFGEENGVRWESTGDGEYTIDHTPPGVRGTKITLYLRGAATHEHTEDKDEEGDDHAAADDQDFTDSWTLKQTIKKYSDFIAFPIVMDNEKWEMERDADGKVVEGGAHDKKITEETLNSMKALWTRSPSSVEKTEYDEFYKHLTRDWQEPAETLHFHVEGMQEFSALLYIAGKAPFDLFAREQRRGLQLYIKRVFISEEVKELIPEYLRFVKGLVDSSDLPLNVSREVVQQDPLLGKIRKTVTNKLLAHLKDMLASDRPKYEKFWGEYGQCIKEAFHYEPGIKNKIADLVLVKTTLNDSWSTLQEVVERSKEGQTAIYYLTGDHLDTLRNAPQLEVFRKRDVEVILLGEPVDEIMVGQLEKYGDKDVKSAARGELDGLPQDEQTKQKVAEAGEKFAHLVSRLKKVLENDVADVRISDRLTDSAVCLVADKDGMSTQLEKMMAQMGQPMPPQKRILELNGDHAVVQALHDLAERDKDDTRLTEFGEMLLDQALLAEGAPLKNPAKFAQRIANAMARAV